METENLILKLALSCQSNEYELSESARIYSVPARDWDSWSTEIQNKALSTFLAGQKPFHLTHQVSKDGSIILSRKVQSRACKPGERQRRRNRQTRALTGDSDSAEKIDESDTDYLIFFLLIILKYFL